MQECVTKKQTARKLGTASTPDRVRNVPLKQKINEALTCARELGYSQHVQERIKMAKNETQIQNALIDGRRSMGIRDDILDSAKKRKKRTDSYRNAK